MLVPLLGQQISQLTETQWHSVKQRFAAYESWIGSKPADAVAALGLDKLRDCRQGSYADTVRQLITHSRETALQMDNVRWWITILVLLIVLAGIVSLTPRLAH